MIPTSTFILPLTSRLINWIYALHFFKPSFQSLKKNEEWENERKIIRYIGSPPCVSLPRSITLTRLQVSTLVSELNQSCFWSRRWRRLLRRLFTDSLMKHTRKKMKKFLSKKMGLCWSRYLSLTHSRTPRYLFIYFLLSISDL